MYMNRQASAKYTVSVQSAPSGANAAVSDPVGTTTGPANAGDFEVVFGGNSSAPDVHPDDCRHSTPSS